MKKVFLLAAMAAAVLAGGGCIFTRNSYVESAEYDLELPKRGAGKVRIGVFSNISGSDRRFLMRKSDGQVLPLEYQRWRLSPELLLQRCIYGAFEIAPDNAEGVPRLNAVIYRFEFDERDGKAHLAVDFSLPEFRRAASGGSSAAVPLAVRADVAVPVGKSGDGAARAAAMGQCAKIAVEKLAAEMRK